MQLDIFNKQPEPPKAAVGGGLFDDIDDPDGLRWYQRDAYNAIMESFTRVRSQLVVMATGGGKCLGRGTPVLMFDGSIRPVELIQEGDLLMGPDSKPRAVRGTTASKGPLYRITPVKGDPWVCNWCHVLTLKHTETGKVVDIPLNEYLLKPKFWKHCHKQFSVPVSFPGSPLRIDPYVLGIWLGDGTKALKGFQITKPDEEIASAVRAFADSLPGYHYSKGVTENRCDSHNVVCDVRPGRGGSPLLDMMRELFPEAPARVAIPHEYLTASRADRLQLLAGLLDTDGYNTGGGFEIVQRKKELADGVAFVARSLGFKVTQATKTVNNTEYTRMCISGDCSVIPLRIPRKQAAARGQKKDALRTGFSVEHIGDGDYFGFELDGDGRFLLGDFTVTHNTRVFSAIAAHWPGKVLVLVHRDELGAQAKAVLEEMCAEHVDTEQAQAFASLKTRVVVATLQTLRGKRMQRFAPDHFGLVIFDEAHHAPAATFRKPLDYFTGAKVLGVTATPDRGDKLAMGTLFEECSFRFDIADGIEQGYLVPIRGRTIELKEVNLDQVKVVAGDFSEKGLDEEMMKGVEGIVLKTIELEPDRQGIAFFPGVRTAEYACERFNAHRPGSACVISGGTDKDLRATLVRDFRAGRYQYLCNCQIATEGFDAPPASMIIQGKPTKSRNNYAQMIGRGTRVLPGTIEHVDGKLYAQERRALIAASGKPDLMILDFVGTSSKHSLMSPEDILGGKYTDAEVAAAKKKKKAGGGDGLTTQQLLDQARAELKAMSKRVKFAKAVAEVKSFNPFSVLHMKHNGQTLSSGEPLSYKQHAALVRFGVDAEEAKKLDRRAASKLLASCIMRFEKGLATYWQLAKLQAHGVTNINISRERATAACNYIAKSKNQPNPKVLDNIVHFQREPGGDDQPY